MAVFRASRWSVGVRFVACFLATGHREIRPLASVGSPAKTDPPPGLRNGLAWPAAARSCHCGSRDDSEKYCSASTARPGP